MTKLKPNIVASERQAADLLIVGLGPGGLFAALKAASQGMTVVALTDRSHYIRGQRVLLSMETQLYLEELIEDDVDQLIIDKLEEENTIQVKDIENFLYRKIQAHPNITIVQINANNSITHIGVSTNKESNYIQLADNSIYFCRNLLAADGAKHTLATLINAELNASITYSQSTLQERHKYHGTVQLQLKKGEQITELETGVNKFKTRAACIKLGWRESFTPQYYVFTNAAQTKFYYVGEIPKCIYDAPNDSQANLLKKWASEAISAKFMVRDEQLEYRVSRKTPAKDRLQSSVFEMNLMVCNKSTFPLANGMFAQIGDARRTPNYHVLHGMNDAIKGGFAFVEALSTKDFKKFEEKIAMMDENVELRMSINKDVVKEATLGAEKKLMVLLDNLIEHLQGFPEVNTSKLNLIIEAKNAFALNGNLTTMYETMDEIKKVISEQQTRVLSQGYECLLAKLETDNTMEKSVQMIEDINNNMDTIFNANY
ncbi:MAG: hypothetical protein Q8R83_01565 [Legionellaceae bacterium]|nr:hypothetical protein [Legionellaceae bacterium]